MLVDLIGRRGSDELADVAVLVTRWDEFRRVPALLRQINRNVLVVDGRRMLRPDEVPEYVGIGLAVSRG